MIKLFSILFIMNINILDSIVDVLKDKAPKSDALSSLIKSTGTTILPFGVDNSLSELRFYIDENNVPNFGIYIGQGSLINALTLTPNEIKINIPLVGKPTFFTDDVTATSNLFVNKLINANSLNIRQDIKILGDITGFTDLNISGTAQIYNKIQTQQINTINDNSNLLSEQSLIIIGKYINIGDKYSSINIQGTTTYVATTELVSKDKTLTLNLQNDNITPVDIGNNSGFVIGGLNGFGYIKSTDDATRFLIKSPASNDVNYIAIVDLNNNMSVSGTTKLFNNTSILSKLYVSNDTILHGHTSLLSSLNVAKTTTFNEPVYNLADVFISGNTTFGNTLSLVNLSQEDRNKLTNIAVGSIIYNTSSQKLNIYN